MLLVVMVHGSIPMLTCKQHLIPAIALQKQVRVFSGKQHLVARRLEMFSQSWYWHQPLWVIPHKVINILG
jgi:hypothetical protein